MHDLARHTEIRAIEAAHRAAQARLGLAVAYYTAMMWEAVSPTRPKATASAWIERVTRMIIVGRQRSLELNKSYYQLVRALDTGWVLGMPDLPAGTPITLPNLRDHFAGLVEEIAQLGFGETGRGDADEQLLAKALADAASKENFRAEQFQRTGLIDILSELRSRFDSDNPALLLDKFEWPKDRDGDYLRGIIEPQLRDEVIKALEAKIARRKQANHSDRVLKDRHAKDHQDSGSRGAGIADWLTIGAGRSGSAYAMRRDKRVRAVGRGTSNNPCYFCAMLASRGFVYQTESSAGFGGAGISKWHPNCHCYPIIRWVSNAQLPPLNLYFKKMWPQVTSGLSGDAAIRAWREWMAERAAELMSKQPPGGA